MKRYMLDGEPLGATLAEFLELNAEGLTHQDVLRAHSLAVGESMVLGGGAAAEFTLARISNDPGDALCPTCEGRGSVSDGTPFKLKCEPCAGSGEVAS